MPTDRSPSESYSIVDPTLPIGVSYSGEHDCPPGHETQGVRDHPFVHLVLGGLGRYTLSDGSEVVLKRGGVFVCFARRRFRYQADEGHPWRYQWFSLVGEGAQSVFAAVNLTPSRPISAVPPGSPAFARMSEVCDLLSRKPPGYQLEAAAAALRFLASTTEPPSRAVSVTATRVGEFVSTMYHRGIGVSDVAEHFGVGRSYLSDRFRRETGRSLHEVITETRLRHACELLTTTDLTVEAVADSVGYSSYRSFVRRFVGEYGCAPTEYRLRG